MKKETTNNETKKVTIDDIMTTLLKIDDNATKGFKGGCDYVQILGDTVATRCQVFITSTKIDVYCGNMTRIYEALTDDNMYKRDAKKQRLITFRGNNRLDLFNEFINQFITVEKKKTTTKKTTNKTKKVSKTA